MDKKLDEMSIEELQEELTALKKQNLAKQIEEQRKLQEADLKKQKELELENIRAEVKAELLAETKVDSKVSEHKAETTLSGKKAEWMTFADVFRQKHKFSGKTYEELAEEVSMKRGW